MAIASKPEPAKPDLRPDNRITLALGEEVNIGGRIYRPYVSIEKSLGPDVPIEVALENGLGNLTKLIDANIEAWKSKLPPLPAPQSQPTPAPTPPPFAWVHAKTMKFGKCRQCHRDMAGQPGWFIRGQKEQECDNCHR